MKIREITPDDLPALTALLAEGFPSKTPAYWQKALDLLTARPRVTPLPQFGLTLENEDALQGVMLMIAQSTPQGPSCNLSSWYMRPDLRKYAPLLFQRSLRFKGVSYTDCSPAPHVLPIVQKFGFTPYTGGSVLLDARAALRGGGGKVAPLDPVGQGPLSAALEAGCHGLMLDGEPVLYRTLRLKRLIPAARFVLGTPEQLVAGAPGLARALLRRGIPVMLIDWPQGTAPATGRLLPQYGLRYCRGDAHPAVGDLSETEIGLFGF